MKEQIEIAELSVKCLAKPNFEVDQFLLFLKEEDMCWRRTPGAHLAEELVEAAGRLCYMSFSERQKINNNTDFIESLISKGHESVLEHVSWSFLITGVSRALTHQLVRHRVGFAFSQLSQQYYEHKQPKFVVPENIRKSKSILSEWKKNIFSNFLLYRNLLNNIKTNRLKESIGKKESLRELRSSARSVLPNSTETKILVTANARAIRHFLDVRGALDGDTEMRAVATCIYKIVIGDAPALFSDFSIEPLQDGSNKVIKVRKLL